MSAVWIILPLYIITCLYVRWQLIWWVKRTAVGSRHSQRPLAVILLALDLVPIIGAFLPESKIQAYCQLFGNVWVGFMAAGAICILLANIVILIKRSSVTSRLATGVLAFVIIATCAYNAYGYIHAQHIYTHYYKLSMTDAGTELISENFGEAENKGDATRLAFIADLHMGVNTQPQTIKHMVDEVCAAKPDYVIGGGDYFTSSLTGLFGSDWYAKELSRMATATGDQVYCAYGNHDVTEPLFCGFAIKQPCEVKRYSDMDSFFDKCNWHMMADETVDIGDFQLIFRKDASKTGDGINTRLESSRLLQAADKTRPVIVIQHEPDELAELKGADLVLSGHTHDGQIWPGNWFTRAVAENAHGYRVVDGVPSIVSSGVGYFGPPLRVGTHAEIVVIDIVK